MSLIREEKLEMMKRYCGRGEGITMQVFSLYESITDSVDGCFNVYLYPFALVPLDRIVLDLPEVSSYFSAYT